MFRDSIFNTSGRHVFAPVEWVLFPVLSEDWISRSKPKTPEPANPHISVISKPHRIILDELSPPAVNVILRPGQSPRKLLYLIRFEWVVC